MKQEVCIEKTYGREKSKKTEFKGIIKGVVVSALALSVFLGTMTPQAYASSFMDKFSQEPNTIEAVYMTESDVLSNLTKTLNLLEELKESGALTEKELVALSVSLCQLNSIAKDTEHIDEVLKILDRAEKLVGNTKTVGSALVRDAVEDVRKHFGVDIVNVKDSTSAMVIYEFSDVKGNEWFYNNVTELVKLGAISGYPDGTFKPNNNISYAEYLKILASSLGAKSTVYTQQEGDEWYAPYIAACYENGILSSYEAIDFNSPITRADAARYTEKALSHIMNEESKDTTDIGSKIRDYNDFRGSVDEYYILQQYAKGIVVGDNTGAFRPASNLTRAEASTIILRAVKPNIRETLPSISKPADEVDNSVTIQEGVFAGRMNTELATKYDLQALETARFYKENGKLYVSIDLPTLPEGYKWQFGIGAYDIDGQYIFYTLNDDCYGKTGKQVIEVYSKYEEQGRTIKDITVTTLDVSILNNDRKAMVGHKLSTDAKNQVLRQSYVSASDAEWVSFDTSKIFNW